MIFIIKIPIVTVTQPWLAVDSYKKYNITMCSNISNNKPNVLWLEQ